MNRLGEIVRLVDMVLKIFYPDLKATEVVADRERCFKRIPAG